MITFVRKSRFKSKEDAQQYIDDKLVELGLHTVAELEDYAHSTTNFEVGSDIDLAILMIL